VPVMDQMTEIKTLLGGTTLFGNGITGNRRNVDWGGRVSHKLKEPISRLPVG